MSKNGNAAPVVAELGRPETPEETAARKAENSRLHRQRQTINNLILSLLATLGVVLILVLIVPRGTGDFETRSVDVQELAQQAEPTAGQVLAAPLMEEEWLAKQAMIRHSKTDQVTHWYVGYTTPSYNYAAVVQGFDSESMPANETWAAGQLENKLATDVKTIAGYEWTVYEHLEDDPKETNVTYGLMTETAEARLIVFGTATVTEIELLAKNTIESLNR